jgi:hypothetical protein
METWDLQPLGHKSKAFEFTHCCIPLENQRAVIRDGGHPGVALVCYKKRPFPRGGAENTINFGHRCFGLGTSPSEFSSTEWKLSKLQLSRYPKDRVPPRTSSKSRQKTRRACVLTCPNAPAPASRLRAALGPSCVPVALAPTSQLRAAPRPPRVAQAPAPAFWLRATPELPRVPWAGSTSCKQLNKYPLATRSS